MSVRAARTMATVSTSSGTRHECLLVPALLHAQRIAQSTTRRSRKQLPRATRKGVRLPVPQTPSEAPAAGRDSLVVLGYSIPHTPCAVVDDVTAKVPWQKMEAVVLPRYTCSGSPCKHYVPLSLYSIITGLKLLLEEKLACPYKQRH